MTIPRILHQIWLGPRDRPKAWMETWQRRHPNWEYRLWTDANIPPLFNRRLYEAYGECWIGKADILRYELLYQYGGVYLDADTECLRPIDELLEAWPTNRDGFAVYAHEKETPGLIANGILGVRPRSPLFRRLVEGMCDLKMPDGAAPWTHVGPQYLTAVAKGDESLWILPSWTFLPEHYSGLRYEGTERPFARHYWHTTTGAWPQEKVRSKILCLIIDSSPQPAWQGTYAAHRRIWNMCLDRCPEVDGYFLRSEPDLGADHVVAGRNFTVRGPERLDTILHKTRTAVAKLLTDHDCVVRTNLSSIFDFPLLQRLELSKENLYTGHVIHDRGWRFVSGAGMILSRDVALKLLTPMEIVLDPHDDVAIWQILNAQGIGYQHREMFCYNYEKPLEQLSVGSHVHYRLKDEHDPARSRECLVTGHAFAQIYGSFEEIPHASKGAPVEMLHTEVHAAYKHYIATVSGENQAISWELSQWLWNFLNARSLHRIVDLGSGWSSALFRFYQRWRPEIAVVSVDNDAAWAARTDAFLASKNLPPGVQTWSEFQRASQDGSFQLVLHDLGTIGTRVDTLDAARRLVQRGGYLILDDLHFSELAHARAWPDCKDLPETRDHFGRFAGIVEIS